jgi:rSAM/selenodomain-associated transferase 1
MNVRQTLIIFVRNPALGKVKTRLASTMGVQKALDIYHILLDKTRQAALGCHAARWLYYSDFVPETDGWNPAFFHKKTQHGDGLGERMERAFQEAFEAGAEKAVIIGSDCPELDGAILDDAFAMLDHADVVLGPVPDGGYYLLGMKTLLPALFHGIEWSTEKVLEKTLEKAAAAGKLVAMLPELYDVDTEADWVKFFQKTCSVQK